MMTLIGVAVIVAYTYNSVVVFDLQGKVFFWELATRIDIMLSDTLDLNAIYYEDFRFPGRAGKTYPFESPSDITRLDK